MQLPLGDSMQLGVEGFAMDGCVWEVLLFFFTETLNLAQVLSMVHLQHTWLTCLFNLILGCHKRMPHTLIKGGEGYHIHQKSRTYVFTFI